MLEPVMGRSASFVGAATSQVKKLYWRSVMYDSLSSLEILVPIPTVMTVTPGIYFSLCPLWPTILLVPLRCLFSNRNTRSKKGRAFAIWKQELLERSSSTINGVPTRAYDKRSNPVELHFSHISKEGRSLQPTGYKTKPESGTTAPDYSAIRHIEGLRHETKC